MAAIVGDGKLLAVKLQDASLIASILPKAMRLATPDGGDAVVAPFDDHSFQIMHRLGYDVNGLDPIRHKFIWAKVRGEYDPKPHQYDIAAFMVRERRGYVLAATRVGKTASASWAAEYLTQQNEIDLVLVFTTKSCVESAWYAQMHDLLPTRRIVPVMGSSTERVKTLEAERSKAWCFIMNHDAPKNPKVFERLFYLVRQRRVLIVIDELTELASVSSDRWETFNNLLNANGAQVARVIGMTGSESSRNPAGVYAQVRLLTPHRATMSASSWQDMTMRKITETKWVRRKEAVQLCADIMAPAIRIGAEVRTSMPPIVENLRATPPQLMLDVLAQLRTEGAVILGDSKVTAVNEAVLWGKFLQITSGCAKDSEGKTIGFDISAKLEILDDLIRRSESKVVVFVPWTAALNAVVDHLKKKRIGVRLVDGSTAAGARAKIFAEFTDPLSDLQVLCCHPKVTAHGLEFACADTIVWWGPPISTEQYVQANARNLSDLQKLQPFRYHLWYHEAELNRYRELENNVQFATAIRKFYATP